MAEPATTTSPTNSYLDRLLNSGTQLFGSYLQSGAASDASRGTKKTQELLAAQQAQSSATTTKILIGGGVVVALIVVVALVFRARR